MPWGAGSALAPRLGRVRGGKGTTTSKRDRILIFLNPNKARKRGSDSFSEDPFSDDDAEGERPDGSQRGRTPTGRDATAARAAVNPRGGDKARHESVDGGRDPKKCAGVEESCGSRAEPFPSEAGREITGGDDEGGPRGSGDLHGTIVDPGDEYAGRGAADTYVSGGGRAIGDGGAVAAVDHSDPAAAAALKAARAEILAASRRFGDRSRGCDSAVSVGEGQDIVRPLDETGGAPVPPREHSGDGDGDGDEEGGEVEAMAVAEGLETSGLEISEKGGGHADEDQSQCCPSPLRLASGIRGRSSSALGGIGSGSSGGGVSTSNNGGGSGGSRQQQQQQ
ncbi:unnamed protein product, partial [Scytosiphon promiscuus]